jgi:hypothetical protein
MEQEESAKGTFRHLIEQSWYNIRKEFDRADIVQHQEGSRI